MRKTYSGKFKTNVAVAMLRYPATALGLLPSIANCPILRTGGGILSQGNVFSRLLNKAHVNPK